MQSLHRRQALGIIATFAISPFANAQPFAVPATVKLVVPFPAGGAVDVVARKMAEAMAKHMGNTFIVENKPGASGAIATRAVAMAAADGGTLLYGHSGLVTAQAMGAKIELLKEFRPVAKFTAGPHFLVVRSDSPYKTQRDLIEAMKTSPGKLNFGSGGAGSPTHLMYEMLEEAVPGIKATHIPFKGAIDAVTALVSGELDFQFALPGASIEFIKSGKLRPLSFTGVKRFAQMPDLHTTAEAGAPGFKAEPWGGFMLPAKTSDALVNAFSDATFVAVNSSEVSQFVERVGSIKAARQTPAEFADEISKELTQQQAIVKRLGMVNN